MPMFLEALSEMIRHYPENGRRIYSEPACDFYGHTFFDLLYTPADKIRFLLNLYPLPPGGTVLDVGCGRGELVLEVAKTRLRRVIGVDLSAEAIEIARSNIPGPPAGEVRVEFHVMNVCRLDLEDDSIDVVYMTDLIEHLADENLRKALSEVWRVLKPGGCLIAHTAPTLFFKQFGQYLVKAHLKKKGVRWLTPTVKEESQIGHVNIQSKASLTQYLRETFPASFRKVFYAPIHPHGALKAWIGALGLWCFLSPHLWVMTMKAEKF